MTSMRGVAAATTLLVFGAQSTASAKVAGQGASAFSGAVSVMPGVWLYQFTDDGLALELTAKGTMYYRDDALN